MSIHMAESVRCMQCDKMDYVGDDKNPTPGIRGVIFVGFFAGNACGFLYLLYSGHFLAAMCQNPLALFGVVLAIGVAGTMSGCFIGLGSQIILKKVRLCGGWWLPITLSGITSAVVGGSIAWFLVALIWESNL